MSRNFLNIVLICIFTSFIVCAHVYKDYTSNAVLLSSVYDAMKNNLQKNIRNNLNRDDVLRDYRNKRNINERVEYYDTHPSDLNAEWISPSIATPRGGDLVCTRRGDTTRITVSDHSVSPGASIFKYGLLLLAAFALPILLFKIFVLPLKILLGLKAISFLNSLLLGTLLYKFSDSYHHKPSGPTYPYPGYPGTGPLPGTIPGVSGAAASAAASSSSSSSSSSSANALDEIEDDSDYVDVVGPGEDMKRILEFVKKRNKNW